MSHCKCHIIKNYILFGTRTTNRIFFLNASIMSRNFLCCEINIVIYWFLYSGLFPRVIEMKENASFAFSDVWHVQLCQKKNLSGRYFSICCRQQCCKLILSFTMVSNMFCNQYQYLFCLIRLKTVLSRSYERTMQLNLCIMFYYHILCTL